MLQFVQRLNKQLKKEKLNQKAMFRAQLIKQT